MKANKELSMAKSALYELEMSLCTKYGVSCWENLCENKMSAEDVAEWHKMQDKVSDLRGF